MELFTFPPVSLCFATCCDVFIWGESRYQSQLPVRGVFLQYLELKAGTSQFLPPGNMLSSLPPPVLMTKMLFLFTSLHFKLINTRPSSKGPLGNKGPGWNESILSCYLVFSYLKTNYSSILIIKLTGDVGGYTLNSDSDNAMVGFIFFRLIHFTVRKLVPKSENFIARHCK